MTKRFGASVRICWSLILIRPYLETCAIAQLIMSETALRTHLEIMLLISESHLRDTLAGPIYRQQM